MTTNKIKNKSYKEPIEKHDTAAWADAEQLKPVSQVRIPCEIQVHNAKEYVDSNEK